MTQDMVPSTSIREVLLNICRSTVRLPFMAWVMGLPRSSALRCLPRAVSVVFRCKRMILVDMLTKAKR